MPAMKQQNNLGEKKVLLVKPRHRYFFILPLQSFESDPNADEKQQQKYS